MCKHETRRADKRVREQSMRAGSRRHDESGMALITVFMVLMVASALMVGFFAAIVADQKENGIDRDQTQAYAAAHAGLEKLTSNLATLFTTDYSPSKAQRSEERRVGKECR